MGLFRLAPVRVRVSDYFVIKVSESGSVYIMKQINVGQIAIGADVA